jgi:hypothetical protein
MAYSDFTLQKLKAIRRINPMVTYEIMFDPPIAPIENSDFS